MWKKLQYTNLFLQYNVGPEVFVTDFVRVWTVAFSHSAFLACVKVSNPCMDIDGDDVDNCKKMLLNPETLKSERTEASKDGGTLNLSILGNKAVFGYPLHLTLKLEEGSKELKVTQPLLVTVQDLRASEQELTQLLRKKDNEIEEYKCEGGEIALRHLKTVPFDESSHKKKHAAFDTHFEEISESLLTKRKEPAPPKILVQAVTVISEPVLPSQVLPPLKKEGTSTTTEIKSEPSSQSKIDLSSPKKKLRKKLNI